MTLLEIRERLSDRNLTTVAERTGLSYPTVYMIAKGRQTNPSYSTIEKLTQYLTGATNDADN